MVTMKDILWISVEDPYMVKNIYKAAAKTKNTDARAMIFPLMESLCKCVRENDNELRTQVRIGY